MQDINVEPTINYKRISDDKSEKISELEGSLLQKNQQITLLNKEITDLYAQVKKYKKRVYELESRSKSPARSVQ